MMRSSLAAYLQALLAVAAVAFITSAWLPWLGLASSALLFLLPVLMASARGGLGPGLLAALGGAAAYNFFLLEPRFTLRVHHWQNFVSVFVLVAVALVTSRLAMRLKLREAEALERARASAEMAALSNLLATAAPEDALAQGLAFLSERYGDMRLCHEAMMVAGDAAFSSLDLSAAAWALHNGDRTGHGTEVMAAAEWSFLPLLPKDRFAQDVVALARPADGALRPAAELDHLRNLCLLLGQSHDHAQWDSERRERAMLRETDKLRRTFLASLAHDLRTPLTVLTGRLELLAAQHGEAQEALAAARQLQRMMQDLLGAARIDAGALKPAADSLDLVDVASAACAGLIVPQGMVLERAIAPDLPFVRGDALLLHHVLTNLLDNGLRHASCHVRLSALAQGDAVMVCVEDDGQGIPEAQREAVFERFHRLSGRDDGQGSGLGLAIVKGFADAMAAKVTLDGSPLGGARFTLALPVATPLAP
jgi:two-component system sensor histidine kinase KdpD